MDFQSNAMTFDTKSLSDLKRQSTLTDQASKEASIKKASKEFESVFLNTILKEARKSTIGEDALLSSEATKTFQGMADAEIAKAMAEKGMGLGELIAKQLSAKQSLLQDPTNGK